MKTLTTLAAAMCILSFASCADKDDFSNAVTAETPSKIDNKPFKLEEYNDKSVQPGDNMYNFSYGKWVASSSTGNLCDMESAIKAKQERITNTPESTHLQQCIQQYKEVAKEGNMFEKDSKLAEEIKSICEEIDEATDQNGVIKIWAKCMKEGYIYPDMLYLGGCDRGLCAYIYLANTSNDEQGEQQYRVSSRAASTLRCQVIDKLMTELGVSPDMVNYHPNERDLILNLDNLALGDLKKMIKVELGKLICMTEPSQENVNNIDTFMQKANLYARFLDVNQYNPVGLWATQQENDAVKRMIAEIKDALVERICDLDWMSNTTKRNAIDKINNIIPVVVATIDARNQNVFESMTDETMCTSYVKMNKGMLKGAISLIGKPRTETNLYLATEYEKILEKFNNLREDANAFYSPIVNSIFICPAYGSYPAIDLTQSEALLYGFLGATIGHELTHSIDKSGASFGKYGEVENWWTSNDYQSFTKRAEDVVQSYSSMDAIPELFPTVKNDGNKTLNENIADIGGLEAALVAYKKHLTKQGIKGEEMDKCLRRMFVACGYDIAYKCNQEDATNKYISDIHSFGQTRMGGMCRNIDEWYRLFNVEQQHKLFLSPERRCKIW